MVLQRAIWDTRNKKLSVQLKDKDLDEKWLKHERNGATILDMISEHYSNSETDEDPDIGVKNRDFRRTRREDLKAQEDPEGVKRDLRGVVQSHGSATSQVSTVREDSVLEIALENQTKENDTELEYWKLKINCFCACVVEAKRRWLPSQALCSVPRCRARSGDEWDEYINEEPDWRQMMLSEYRTWRLKDLEAGQDDQAVGEGIRWQTHGHRGTAELHSHKAREDMMVKMAVEDKRRRRRRDVSGRRFGHYYACVASADAVNRWSETQE